MVDGDAKYSQASTVQAIERNIKTAIVDKVPSVSSAALVSSYHLLPVARDIVRRWQSETQEAASTSKSSGGFMGFGAEQVSQGERDMLYSSPSRSPLTALWMMRAPRPPTAVPSDSPVSRKRTADSTPYAWRCSR